MQLFVLLSFSYSTLINFFDPGTFRLRWSEAVIQPIHKKGDINSPDNYRGMSLLNVSGKLHNYILNKCLATLLEDTFFSFFLSFFEGGGGGSVCSDLDQERMDYTQVNCISSYQSRPPLSSKKHHDVTRTPKTSSCKFLHNQFYRAQTSFLPKFQCVFL